MLGGGVRDALVGGNLLIGVAFGVGLAIWSFVVDLHREGSGVLSTETNLNLASLLGVGHMTFVLDNSVVVSIFVSLLLLLFLFLLRTTLRRMWIAAVVFIVVLTLGFVASIGLGHVGLFDWVTLPLYSALLVFVLTRFGILTLIVTFSVADTLGSFPLTVDLSTWYAGSSLFAFASVLTLTAYALYTALAGRPLFKAEFLDSD